MGFTNLLNHLRDIGIEQANGVHQEKLSRLLNLVCFYGFFTAILQFLLYLSIDIVAALSHLIWGVLVLICLAFRRQLGYNATKSIIFSIVVAFGSYASARLGNETLGHVPVASIYVAIFIFYDLKKEWFKIAIFFIYTTSAILIIDSNNFKVVNIPESDVQLMRAMTIVGTLIFISVEIILLVKLSALSENAISKKLSIKNEQLLELNKEKTVLLQEVHHRVKNNFQIISSLLKLQAKELNNEDVIFAFQQAISRINAVSQLHEQIYKSNSIADVDLKLYLETIAQTIIENHSDNKEINLNINEITLKLDNNTILPLALIFNELLTNSLKHAFNDMTIGDISIQLTQTNNKLFEFAYQDNGKWKAPDTQQTFGLELIETLCGQLDGRYERTIDDNGTKYAFSLSLKN